MAALLISEKTIKEVFPFLENMAGGYLLPSIREAQSLGLRYIIGDNLYRKLIELVGNREISSEANAKYRALLDECQNYLLYRTIVELIPRTSLKIANMGVIRTTDENVQYASFDEMVRHQKVYESKADAYCADLQRFILDNRTDYPELTEGHCRNIKAQLYSMASCGIFLGGPRGKGGRNCGGC